MADQSKDTFKHHTYEELSAGTELHGVLSNEALAIWDILDRTYSWRDRYLRASFVLEEASELLEDASAIDDTDKKRVSYARLEARGIEYGQEVNGVIKLWASREVSLRRRWLSTLKMWKWIITLSAPIPAIAGATYLGEWAIRTCLGGLLPCLPV